MPYTFLFGFLLPLRRGSLDKRGWNVLALTFSLVLGFFLLSLVCDRWTGFGTGGRRAAHGYLYGVYSPSSLSIRGLSVFVFFSIARYRRISGGGYAYLTPAPRCHYRYRMA